MFTLAWTSLGPDESIIFGVSYESDWAYAYASEIPQNLQEAEAWETWMDYDHKIIWTVDHKISVLEREFLFWFLKFFKIHTLFQWW